MELCSSGLRVVGRSLATFDFSVDSDCVVGLRPLFPAGIMAMAPMMRYEPNGVSLVVGAEAP